MRVVPDVHWQHRGACTRPGSPVDPDDFFEADDVVLVEAPAHIRRLCDGCPVRVECLEAGRGQVGIWGGLTTFQRTQVGRRMTRRTCPACYGDSVVPRRSDEHCLACGLSWPAPVAS